MPFAVVFLSFLVTQKEFTSKVADSLNLGGLIADNSMNSTVSGNSTLSA